MELLLQRHANSIYYFPLNTDLTQLPKRNWICLGIANTSFDSKQFEIFLRFVSNRSLVQFITQGKFSEELQKQFEHIMNVVELYEESPVSQVVSVAYGSESDDLYNSLWGCFYGNVLPEGIDSDQITVVCIGFDGINYEQLLQDLVKELEKEMM